MATYNHVIILALQVIRTELVYWQTKRPENFSKENFPVFIGKDGDDNYYGTPIHEYPGLIKVWLWYSALVYCEILTMMRCWESMAELTSDFWPDILITCPLG